MQPAASISTDKTTERRLNLIFAPYFYPGTARNYLNDMRIRKRIELDKIKFSKEVIIPENIDEIEGNNTQILLPDCCIEFKLEGENLNGFGPQYAAAVTDQNGSLHPHMGGWPESEISFSVTEEDLPRVNAWFTDDYRGVNYPESSLLQKNRKSAVHSALAAYFLAAQASNLFTSPFRIGWRYRLKDGNVGHLHDCGLISTFISAPHLPVMRYSIAEKTLYTRAQIRNVPAKLKFRFALPDDSTAMEIMRNAESIEIFATNPVSLYSTSDGVSGIRTIIIDGEPKRCWHYTSYGEADIILKANQDESFRRICTISADEIEGNQDFTTIPMSAGTLAEFSKLPAAKDSDSSSSPSAPAGNRLIVRTEPLHLDYPDKCKSIRSIALRGVFPRDKVKMKIYGSIHREDWHLVADSVGPFISGLHGMRWRWLKAEIESPVREGDFFEALSFTFNI